MLLRAVRMRPKRPWELSRWLQHGLRSSQDGPKTAQGASKMPLGRLGERSGTSQDASRTAPSAPKTPPRLSWRLQDVSGRRKMPPRPLRRELSTLQETSNGDFPRSPPKLPPAVLQPQALWPAVGLGGMREAETIWPHRSAPELDVEPPRPLQGASGSGALCKER